MVVIFSKDFITIVSWENSSCKCCIVKMSIDIYSIRLLPNAPGVTFYHKGTDKSKRGWLPTTKHSLLYFRQIVVLLPQISDSRSLLSAKTTEMSAWMHLPKAKFFDYQRHYNTFCTHSQKTYICMTNNNFSYTNINELFMELILISFIDELRHVNTEKNCYPFISTYSFLPTNISKTN